MAEKKVSSESGTTAVADAPEQKKEDTKGKDIFKHRGELEEGVKLAPQAQGIVDILKEAKKGLTRDELVKAMTGVITTRQPEGRILSYYQKLLVESGAITIDKAA